MFSDDSERCPNNYASSSDELKNPFHRPGFYYVPETEQYYSLERVPAVIIKNALASGWRIDERGHVQKKKKEPPPPDNELRNVIGARKRFKHSIVKVLVNSSVLRTSAIFSFNYTSSPSSRHVHHPRSTPRSFPDALFRREIGGFLHPDNQNRGHFLESVSALCAARLPLPQGDEPGSQQFWKKHGYGQRSTAYNSPQRTEELKGQFAGRVRLLYTPRSPLSQNLSPGFENNFIVQQKSTSAEEGDSFLFGALNNCRQITGQLFYETMCVTAAESSCCFAEEGAPHWKLSATLSPLKVDRTIREDEQRVIAVVPGCQLGSETLAESYGRRILQQNQPNPNSNNLFTSFHVLSTKQMYTPIVPQFGQFIFPQLLELPNNQPYPFILGYCLNLALEKRRDIRRNEGEINHSERLNQAPMFPLSGWPWLSSGQADNLPNNHLFAALVAQTGVWFDLQRLLEPTAAHGAIFRRLSYSLAQGPGKGKIQSYSGSKFGCINSDAIRHSKIVCAHTQYLLVCLLPLL